MSVFVVTAAYSRNGESSFHILAAYDNRDLALKHVHWFADTASAATDKSKFDNGSWVEHGDELAYYEFVEIPVSTKVLQGVAP
jgi:hypothetical protein